MPLPLLPLLALLTGGAIVASRDKRNQTKDIETILGIQDFVNMRAYIRSILETHMDEGLALIQIPAVSQHVRDLWSKETGVPLPDHSALMQKISAMMRSEE